VRRDNFRRVDLSIRSLTSISYYSWHALLYRGNITRISFVLTIPLCGSNWCSISKSQVDRESVGDQGEGYQCGVESDGELRLAQEPEHPALLRDLGRRLRRQHHLRLQPRRRGRRWSRDVSRSIRRLPGRRWIELELFATGDDAALAEAWVSDVLDVVVARAVELLAVGRAGGARDIAIEGVAGAVGAAGELAAVAVRVGHRRWFGADVSHRRFGSLRQNGLFWSFLYVCPEPVLVKR
jgi:hypothetical protein